MLQRPGERNPWQPGLHRIDQPHDNDENIEIPQVHYFGPSKFYCVEQFVHHVVLLLHGQNLTSQNHQPIFSNF